MGKLLHVQFSLKNEISHITPLLMEETINKERKAAYYLASIGPDTFKMLIIETSHNPVRV